MNLTFICCSTRSLSNLAHEAEAAHNKDIDSASHYSQDNTADILGIPSDTAREGSSDMTALQAQRASLQLSASRGRPPAGPPSTLLSKQSSLNSQQSYNVDHRNHSHVHGVCHEDAPARAHLSDADHLSSVALGLRLRDLRRLDFSINPNEQLDVQVTSIA